jgi:hypothetical protein
MSCKEDYPAADKQKKGSLLAAFLILMPRTCQMEQLISSPQHIGDLILP